MRETKSNFSGFRFRELKEKETKTASVSFSSDGNVGIGSTPSINPLLINIENVNQSSLMNSVQSCQKLNELTDQLWRYQWKQ